MGIEDLRENLVKGIAYRGNVLMFYGAPVVLISTSTLVGIFHSLEEVMGSGAQALLYRAGLNSARRIAPTVKRIIREAGMEGIATFYREVGWGVPEFGEESVEWRDSFIARAWVENGFPRGKVCHFLRGYVHGLWEAVKGGRVERVVEEECIANGDARCLFRVVPG